MTAVVCIQQVLHRSVLGVLAWMTKYTFAPDQVNVVKAADYLQYVCKRIETDWVAQSTARR